MTINNYRNISRWLAIAVLVFATSCTSDEVAGNSTEEGETDVTFTILAEQGNIMRDAAAEDGTETPTVYHISDGLKADMVVYAVYDAEGNLLEKYGNSESEVAGITPGTGQTVASFTERPKTVTIKQLERGKTYKIAFWAQSSQTQAFDYSDLKKVEVKYDNAANNDELRDAFCKVVTMTIKKDDNNQTVILKRPMAQINVGSAGWDYEGAAVLKPNEKIYTHSTITLNGVYKYFDVVDDKVLTDKEVGEGETATTNVTFNLAKLPAFYSVQSLTDDQYVPYEGEEFLKADFDHDDDFSAYVGWNAYKAKTEEEDFDPEKSVDTETFKYLSMCYVLVGGTASEGSTVSVTCWVADNENEASPYKLFQEIPNVPVQRNWRTNIVSNSFFVSTGGFKIYIIPDYCGDRNQIDGEWNNQNKEGKTDNLGNIYIDGNKNTDFPDPGQDYNPTTSGE